jgi:hypothetical protein
MKAVKPNPYPNPNRPPPPTVPGKLPPGATSSAATGPADPPDPNQFTTEEAIEAWRNEGDPN